MEWDSLLRKVAQTRLGAMGDATVQLRLMAATTIQLTDLHPFRLFINYCDILAECICSFDGCQIRGAKWDLHKEVGLSRGKE